MPLPKSWCTERNQWVVDFLNKKYSKTCAWIFQYYGENQNWHESDDKKWWKYLTPEQFMEAIKTEEFKRGDIVIDNYGDEVEYVCDLWEADTMWDRFIVRNNEDYVFRKSITKKEEISQETIDKAIELLTKAGKIKDGKILI